MDDDDDDDDGEKEKKKRRSNDLFLSATSRVRFRARQGITMSAVRTSNEEIKTEVAGLLRPRRAFFFSFSSGRNGKKNAVLMASEKKNGRSSLPTLSERHSFFLFCFSSLGFVLFFLSLNEAMIIPVRCFTCGKVRCVVFRSSANEKERETETN